MWKCFNRGVWGSANALKVEQSNGACIITSLVNKDLDDLAPLSNSKSKCTHCVSESLGNNSSTAQHKTRTYPSPPQKSDESVFEEHTTQPCKNLSHQTYDICQHENSNPSAESPDFTKVGDGYGVIGHNRRVYASYFCKTCRQIRTDYDKCLCTAKPPLLLWLSNKLGAKSHVDITSSVTSLPSKLPKNSNFKYLSSECSSPNFRLLEENKNSSLISTKLDSSLPIVVETSPSSQLSVLCHNHPAEEKKNLDLPINHTHSSLTESRSHVKSSFCLLKLPFLTYNVAGFKGLTRFSACWLNKNRNEFGRDGNKNQGGDGNGESKETKEDAWRHYQIHQSLLEAIGWSSAILLGWFLAQCRIWRLCGEGCTEKRKKEGERRKCIAGMVARLLFSWKHDTHPSLKDLPSELKERIERNQRKKENYISTDEDKIRLESCNGGSEGYSSDTLIQFDGVEEEGFSSDDEVFSRSSDNVQKSSKKLSKEISSFSKVNERNVIPMPWHADSQEKLPFGPITLEEAIKEAERGLEEAQAEILLLLALEKLEEGENSSQSGPSPVELLDSAACLGSAAAAFNLGICYEMGVGGVAKDLTQAYYWYKKASDNGHATATYNIAVFHAQGLGGLCPDTNLASRLLEKASLMGHPEATDALSRINSLEPAENHDICQTDSVQAKGNDVSQHSNHDNDQLWEVNDIQKDGGSNGIHTSKFTANSSLMIEWSTNTALNLDHLMESCSLPFSKLDEMEEPLVDVLFDSPPKVKRRDFDYKSTTLYAQQNNDKEIKVLSVFD